jgi:hypothetical protein
MGMKDVVEIFEVVGIGAKVVITRDKLPHGSKAEEPKPTPEEESIVAEKKTETPATSDAAPASAAPADQAKEKADKPTSAPVAKSKSKKPATKAEKITTGNRRSSTGHLAQG